MHYLTTPDSASAVTLTAILARFDLTLHWVDADCLIPGSYWGTPEAGLIGNTVYLRGDTPTHSVLHEACHAICMDDVRRSQLDTDAGGDPIEECGVCYLSILLARQIPDFGEDAMLSDMDEWGYSFRLGSARTWFLHDAEDARDWLRMAGLLPSNA
ncbi:MAG: hypothetical protein H6978_01915 [Gammaproteobacteria bacterium]|nr:hypothetical protein [Gammaproteobacteria bacterium]